MDSLNTEHTVWFHVVDTLHKMYNSLPIIATGPDRVSVSSIVVCTCV